MSSTRAPPVFVPNSGNNIIVNPCQRGNPVLECIRNVGKEFGDIGADYQVGRTTGVLFLSLRYHRLHPEYILVRIEKLGHSYDRRFLLILCDITQHREPIRELTKSCLINNITIIVAFSNEEAGHYLSVYKQYESKPPDMIKERVDKDYNAILRSALTTIPKVNKTDVETLRSTFGSFSNISNATSDQLRNLPGFGQVKVKNIENAFKKSFRNDATTKLTELQQPNLAQIAPTQGLSREGNKSQPIVPPNSTQRPPREPSPTWDIELDLNEDDNEPEILDASSSSKRAKSNHLIFDIDLDP